MDPHTPSILAFFGIPVFSLVAGSVLLAAVVSLIVGLCRWKRTSGKVMALVGGFVLLILLAVVACVLLTVMSGSMG